MIDIRKLAMPFVMIGPLVGGALVIGGAWASNKNTNAELEKRAAHSEERVADLERRQAGADVQHAEVKTDLKYLTEAIRRIEDKLGTAKR